MHDHTGAKMCWWHVHLNHHIWRNSQPPNSSFSHSHGFHHFCCCFHVVVRLFNISAYRSQFCLSCKFSYTVQWCQFQSFRPTKSKPSLVTNPFLTFTPNNHSRPYFYSILFIKSRELFTIKLCFNPKIPSIKSKLLVPRVQHSTILLGQGNS